MALFLFCFCLYGLSGPGHSSLADGFVSFLTARSVYRDHRLSIDQLPAGGMRPGIDGKSYSVYGPAAALVMIPALAAGDGLPAILQPRVDGTPVDPLRRDEFWMTFTNAALMAGVIVLLFRCGIELGASSRAVLAVALSAALASPLWLYARIDSSEALQALGLLGAFTCLSRWRRDGGLRWLPIAGTFLAVSVAAKFVNFLCVPWLAILAVGRDDGFTRSSRNLFALLSPVLVAAVLIAEYNDVRFGSPWSTGYGLGIAYFSHPPVDGAARLLFHPSYGLLFLPATGSTSA